MLDVRNPATGEVIARIPNSTADDVDRAMKSARAAFEGKSLGRHGHPRPRAAGQPPGGRVRGQSRAAVPAGDAQQRPAAQRDPRAAVAAAGFFPLFCGTGAGAARRGDPGRRLLSELHAAHADRHRRQLHAVQSSADDHVQIARRGAGERLRHGGEAVGIYAADDVAAGADLHRGGPAARRVQRRARPRRRPPAGCSPSMATSTSWC